MTRYLRVLPYAVLLAGAAFLYWKAGRLEFVPRPGTLGPDAWPKGLLAVIIALTGWEVLRRLLSAGAAREAEGAFGSIVSKAVPQQPAEAEPEVPEQRHPLRLLAGMGLTVAYVWMVPRLGFFLATVPYLILFMAFGGYRRWKTVFTVSLVGTLLMLFFFMKVVYVSLPLGVAPFADVSLFLMKIMGIK